MSSFCFRLYELSLCFLSQQMYACTLCILIKEISVFLSALFSNHFMCLPSHISFLKPLYFSIWLCDSLLSSPRHVLITFLPHFPLTSLCPILSRFLWNINAWNLHISSANAGVRLLTRSLCWWTRGAGGRGFLWERWKARRQPVNAPQTCLGVTNPSDSALSAVSRSSWLIWSYCSILGLVTKKKKKNPKMPNWESWTRRSWVVTRDTTNIRVMFPGVKKKHNCALFCSLLVPHVDNYFDNDAVIVL